jgi:hypothetical protein
MAAMLVGGLGAHNVSFTSLNSGEVKLSSDGKVRVSLLQSYLSQYQGQFKAIDGYIVACNYDAPNAANPVDQGLVNPYLNLTQRVQQAIDAAGGDPWKLLTANAVFFPLGELTPSELGSGKVPTYNSTDSISWFYIPAGLAAPR